MLKQKAEREKRFELQKNDIDALSFDSSNELELIKKVALEYEGDLTRLGSAFGCLFMCKIYGYKVIRLAYDAKTVAKYEKFFQRIDPDFKFKNYSQELGPLADRSVALRLVREMGKFWAVVRGEVPGRSPTVDSGIDSLSRIV